MKNLIVALLFIVISPFMVQAQDADRAAAGTMIGITIKGVPTEEATVISSGYQVDNAGTIILPYLEKTPIKVSGLTGRQIELKLASAYKDAQIFTHPVFVVTLTADGATVRTDFVHVNGFVASKRNVPFRKGLTLIAAITEAGDITDFGSRYIQVTRKGRTETYDYFSVRDRNMALQPGDQLFVRQRGAFEGRPSKLLP